MKFETLKFDFKQELGSDTLEIRLYGEVKADSENWWTGEITKSKTSQDHFAEELDKHKDVKNIILYINSEGGSVEQGYGIYANLKRHPAHKTCYVDGFANSIASIIAMSCDKIVMYVNSVMGIHNMSMPCWGNAAEHRKCADDLDRLMEGNREIYMQRSGGKITLERLTELLDNETYLTAKECLEYGFCDEIDEAKPADPEKLKQAAQNMYLNAQQSFEAAQSLHQAAKQLDDGKDGAAFDLFECMKKTLI